MKLLTLLAIVFLTGCTSVQKTHPSLIDYEEFSVETKCFDMIVLSVDVCTPGSMACKGYVSPKGEPTETFYTFVKKGTPVGGITKNCYTMRKDNGEQISQYLLYK